ncbi:hypothetical protein [Microbulbifer sp. ALW1]|uniref:hypothetical protein n=1 Tax=Microbulbifer sp. (strain ALW1) TaxID=1516059 RepID=UPI001359441A|nr:hypothetical protein [Microbulbifer sp. ALW1]
MNEYISFLAIAVLCVIAISLPHWSTFKRDTHPPILSVSAGIGITYVFLGLLPKLAEVQASLKVSEDSTSILPVELHAYLGALAGFIIFLLIINKGFFEDININQRRVSFGEILIFAVFGVYYAQIGFSLGDWPSEIVTGYFGLVAALAMHFVGINYHLWKRYPRRYPIFLRWFFCLCLLLGWVTAISTEQLTGIVKLSTMFVAGGIIITATREEIPSSKDAHILYFLASVIITTAFILLLKILVLK